jgi:hypothetical protein
MTNSSLSALTIGSSADLVPYQGLQSDTGAEIDAAFEAMGRDPPDASLSASQHFGSASWLYPQNRILIERAGMSALCQKRILEQTSRKLHSLGQPDIVRWEQVIHDHKPDDRQWRREQSAHRAPHPGPIIGPSTNPIKRSMPVHNRLENTWTKFKNQKLPATIAAIITPTADNANHR